MPFFERAPLLLATKKVENKSVGKTVTAGSVKITKTTLLPLSEQVANDGNNVMQDVTQEDDQEPNMELDSSGRSKVPAAECDRRVEACRFLARKIIRRYLDR